MPARLGLGTVQFGMNYGVSNRHGRPSEAEVAAILDRAEESGVGYLDTAYAYPNAEAVIGRHLAPGSQFRIVTKTMPIASSRIERGDKARVLDALASSMERLRTDCLYGVLVHHATDLGKAGSEYLVEALEEARSRGWVLHIGASVYNEEQLELVESRFLPEIIQGPLNILDRRLTSSKCFARLKANGTEIHARSIFLQGLLLMSSRALPDFFEPLKAMLASLHANWAEQGVTPLAACLQFALQHPGTDVVMVGVNSLAEFDEIQAAISFDSVPPLADRLPSIEIRYLDPSLWPSFAN